MWNREGLNSEVLADIIYGHMEEFKLMLASPNQALFHEFIHALVDLEIQSTELYFSQAKALGHALRIPDREQIHMIANAQFSAFFEIVLHDIPREKGIAYIADLHRFFVAGWKEIVLNQ